MDDIYWVNFIYPLIIYKLIQQQHIIYTGQRFQQSTKFVLSVGIIEYNLSIKSIYQYNTYYS
jgi:hypothetical protein